MEYKGTIKKQSTIILIGVICLTLLVVGTSYALFFQVNTNTTNQVIKSGTLQVTYGNQSSSISATSLTPLSDTEALSSSTMTSTIYIENTGSLKADYLVKIGNDLDSFEAREGYTESDQLVNHQYIRIAAYIDGVLIVKPTTLSSLTVSEGDTDMYNLYSGTLDIASSGNASKTMVIKIWLAVDAPTSVIDQYTYLKIDVTSEVSTETRSDLEVLYADTLINTLNGVNYNKSVKGPAICAYYYFKDSNEVVWTVPLLVSEDQAAVSLTSNSVQYSTTGSLTYSNGKTYYYSATTNLAQGTFEDSSNQGRQLLNEEPYTTIQDAATALLDLYFKK